MSDFARKLLAWHDKGGRHDLPWQHERTPYRVWVSEVMLQQTQVSTVIPYFVQFMDSFPDIKALAEADIDDVLHHWTGLGYYARCRNLHKAAKIVTDVYEGLLPDNIYTLMKLPGIGRSTAGAILSLSLNQRQPILDGNVKRVLTRYKGISGWPGERKTEDKLWLIADKLTPSKNVSAYNQAIMDLGATICKRSVPVCLDCPVMSGCFACHNSQQLTLPNKKKKKKLPTRLTIFTIIENDKGEILLEKRPPKGVWGGLWSFPECPINENIVLWIKKQYGRTVSNLTELNTLRHTLSHLHLDIHPVKAQLKTDSVSFKGQREIFWYKPKSKSRFGMAAPVVRILQTI